MSFNIKDTESKVTPAKKTLDLKNISVADLKLIDTDTGEDISEAVIEAIPFDTINFKITFEIPELDESVEADEE